MSSLVVRIDQVADAMGGSVRGDQIHLGYAGWGRDQSQLTLDTHAIHFGSDENLILVRMENDSKICGVLAS